MQPKHTLEGSISFQLRQHSFAKSFPTMRITYDQ